MDFGYTVCLRACLFEFVVGLEMFNGDEMTESFRNNTLSFKFINGFSETLNIK